MNNHENDKPVKTSIRAMATVVSLLALAPLMVIHQPEKGDAQASQKSCENDDQQNG